MKIYCTICCKEKSLEKNLVNAIDRYISNRINKIYKLSKKDKIEFRILSGKFGLLKPDEKIPFYDVQLFSKDVENMIKIVSGQLSSQNIDQLIFFVRDSILYPDWKPYIKLLGKSCSLSNTKFILKKIKESSE